jgi:hypothetical protein
MDVVSNIRTEMNNGWEQFPEWIKEVFLPIKDVVIILLDQNQDTLARDTVLLQRCSVDETAERQAEFNVAKQSIIDAINGIIQFKYDNDPMRRPEVQEEVRQAAILRSGSL